MEGFMRSILYTKDETIRGQLVARLLYMGVNVFSVNSFEKFELLLDSNEITCIFLDIDNDIINSIEFIKRIREHENNLEVFISIITSRENEQYLPDYVCEGVNTIFYKEQAFADYILKIIPKIYESLKLYEKRRFERVVPRTVDDVGINIEIKGKSNYGFFKGRLIDISVAGLALELEDKLALDHIKEDDANINTLQVKIGDKIYYCDGVVTRKSDAKIAVRYTKTNKFFRDGISSFILKKINYC